MPESIPAGDPGGPKYGAFRESQAFEKKPEIAAARR
jgi:hypothetical protein